MSEFKTVIINYCFCGCVCSLLEILLPKNSKKVFRIVCSSVLTVFLVTPLIKADIKTDLFDFSQYEKTNDNTGSLLHLQNEFEKKISDNIKNILINLNIDEYEIYITSEIIEENTISLKEVKVQIGKAYENDLNKIKNSLSEYKDVLVLEVKKDSG